MEAQDHLEFPVGMAYIAARCSFGRSTQSQTISPKK